MPKDDVDMKREEEAKKDAEGEVDNHTEEYVPDRGSTPTPHSSPQVSGHNKLFLTSWC